MRAAPRKAQLVVDQIRGRTVPEARTILAFLTRDAARDVRRVLDSAVANAEANHGLVADELVVAAAYVGAGPTAQALAGPRARPGGPHPQADLPHHRRARAADRGGDPRADRASQAGRAGPAPSRVAEETPAEEAPAEEEKPKKPRASRKKPAAEADDGGGGGGRGDAQAAPHAHHEAEGRGRARPPSPRSRRRRASRGARVRRRARRRPMGQKVHPGGLRVGVIHDWKSNWYTGSKEFPAYIIEDVKIRDHIYGKLGHAGLSDILIRKDKQRITIDIYTARPGIVIGKSGAEVDALRREVHAMTQKNVQININEIKRPELDAKLVAQSIAEQLQNRVSFRRAMKRSLASAIRSGAQGVKITCGGRLGGSEMSRSETYSEGKVPAPYAARGHRLRLRRGADDHRPHRREGLDQQGRDHARGLRLRPGCRRSPRRAGPGAPARRTPRRAWPRFPRVAGEAATARASGPSAGPARASAAGRRRAARRATLSPPPSRRPRRLPRTRLRPSPRPRRLPPTRRRPSRRPRHPRSRRPRPRRPRRRPRSRG